MLWVAWSSTKRVRIKNVGSSVNFLIESMDAHFKYMSLKNSVFVFPGSLYFPLTLQSGHAPQPSQLFFLLVIHVNNVRFSSICSNTSTSLTLLVHGILNVRCQDHISNSFSLEFSSFNRVFVSNPYTGKLLMKCFFFKLHGLGC